MKTSSLLLAVFCFVLQVSLGSGLVLSPAGPTHQQQQQHLLHARRRSRRSLFQMCDLIQRYTNRGCLDYYSYGCFCGLGNAGHGRKHVDDADGCCRLHDNCYGEVHCFWTYVQLVGYSIECGEEGCQCQDSPVWSPCARSVCDCDLRFAECLGRAGYNEHHRNYDWHLCDRN
ncbi:basic phospholipase A2-like isoform X2 [Babylonia areolata]|uniref:basic phospholipase A2-like isoform X2 n=1 Tax=Babylonia areolata TaxID=304850 RepID=UPI003FD4B37F